MWGDATPKVLNQYRQGGLELDDAFRGEPPDHVELELQFMAFLCEQEAAAEEQNGLRSKVQKAQHNFLREHPCGWFPLFRERAMAYKPHPFYEGVFLLTEEWLNLHEQYLSACLGKSCSSSSSSSVV